MEVKITNRSKVDSHVSGRIRNSLFTFVYFEVEFIDYMVDLLRVRYRQDKVRYGESLRRRSLPRIKLEPKRLPILPREFPRLFNDGVIAGHITGRHKHQHFGIHITRSEFLQLWVDDLFENVVDGKW